MQSCRLASRSPPIHCRHVEVLTKSPSHFQNVSYTVTEDDAQEDESSSDDEQVCIITGHVWPHGWAGNLLALHFFNQPEPWDQENGRNRHAKEP